MPALHWPELLVLLAILVLIFGASRLPQIGGSIGKTIKEFQKSMREVSPGDEAKPIAPPASDAAAPQTAEPPPQ